MATKVYALYGGYGGSNVTGSKVTEDSDSGTVSDSSSDSSNVTEDSDSGSDSDSSDSSDLTDDSGRGGVRSRGRGRGRGRDRGRSRSRDRGRSKRKNRGRKGRSRRKSGVGTGADNNKGMCLSLDSLVEMLVSSVLHSAPVTCGVSVSVSAKRMKDDACVCVVCMLVHIPMMATAFDSLLLLIVSIYECLHYHFAQELMQIQRFKKEDTVVVFGVGVGDGKEQLSIAAACSHKDWNGCVKSNYQFTDSQ